MPMLTPTPSLGTAVPVSPSGEPNTASTASAQTAGGESREGNPTNTQQSTWTRLFQSLLANNLNSDGATAPGGSAPTRKKAAKGGADSATSTPAPSSPALQAPVMAVPVLQAPIAAAPLLQPLGSSSTSAKPASEPQPVVGPSDALLPGQATSNSPAGPTADSALTEVQTATVQPGPAQSAQAGESAPNITSPQASTNAQPAYAAQQLPLPVSSMPEAAEAALASPPLPSAQGQNPAPAGSASAPVAASTTVAQAGAASAEATPANNSPTPSSPAAGAPAAATLASMLLSRLANAPVPGNQPATLGQAFAAQGGAPNTPALPAANTNSQIAQDDRISGIPSPSAQTSRQGGRPLLSGAATSISQTTRVVSPSIKTAAPATRSDQDSVSPSRSEENSSARQEASQSTTDNGASSSADAAQAAASQASTANGSNNVSNNAPNPQLVQGSSQAERIGVIQQIASQVASANPASGVGSTVTMQLHPAHWGDVTISITTTPAAAGATGADARSAVSATIVSADPAVRDALQAHVQDLSRALTGSGFHVDKLEVAAQAMTATTGGQGSDAFRQGQNSGGSGGGGYLPNPSGAGAHSGGDGRQNQSFSAAFGQNQDGQRNGSRGYQNVPQNTPMQQEVEGQTGSTTQTPRQGLVDYRI